MTQRRFKIKKYDFNKNSYLYKFRQEVTKSTYKIKDESMMIEKIKIKDFLNDNASTNTDHMMSTTSMPLIEHKSPNRKWTNTSGSELGFFKTGAGVKNSLNRKPSFINSFQLQNILKKTKTQAHNNRQSVLWEKSPNTSQIENKPVEAKTNYRVKTYKIKFIPDWYQKNGIVPKNFQELGGKDIEIQSAIVNDEIKIFLDNMNYYRTHYLHSTKVSLYVIHRPTSCLKILVSVHR
jgi:hypothetical protein